MRKKTSSPAKILSICIAQLFLVSSVSYGIILPADSSTRLRQGAEKHVHLRVPVANNYLGSGGNNRILETAEEMYALKKGKNSGSDTQEKPQKLASGQQELLDKHIEVIAEQIMRDARKISKAKTFLGTQRDKVLEALQKASFSEIFYLSENKIVDREVIFYNQMRVEIESYSDGSVSLYISFMWGKSSSQKIVTTPLHYHLTKEGALYRDDGTGQKIGDPLFVDEKSVIKVKAKSSPQTDIWQTPLIERYSQKITTQISAFAKTVSTDPSFIGGDPANIDKALQTATLSEKYHLDQSTKTKRNEMEISLERFLTGDLLIHVSFYWGAKSAALKKIMHFKNYRLHKETGGMSEVSDDEMQPIHPQLASGERYRENKKMKKRFALPPRKKFMPKKHYEDLIKKNEQYIKQMFSDCLSELNDNTSFAGNQKNIVGRLFQMLRKAKTAQTPAIQTTGKEGDIVTVSYISVQKTYNYNGNVVILISARFSFGTLFKNTVGNICTITKDNEISPKYLASNHRQLLSANADSSLSSNIKGGLTDEDIAFLIEKYGNDEYAVQLENLIREIYEKYGLSGDSIAGLLEVRDAWSNRSDDYVFSLEQIAANYVIVDDIDVLSDISNALRAVVGFGSFNRSQIALIQDIFILACARYRSSHDSEEVSAFLAEQTWIPTAQQTAPIRDFSLMSEAGHPVTIGGLQNRPNEVPPKDTGGRDAPRRAALERMETLRSLVDVSAYESNGVADLIGKIQGGTCDQSDFQKAKAQVRQAKDWKAIGAAISALTPEARENIDPYTWKAIEDAFSMAIAALKQSVSLDKVLRGQTDWKKVQRLVSKSFNRYCEKMKKQKAHVITLSGDDVLQNRTGFSRLLKALPENVHVLVITNTETQRTNVKNRLAVKNNLRCVVLSWEELQRQAKEGALDAETYETYHRLMMDKGTYINGLTGNMRYMSIEDILNNNTAFAEALMNA